MSSVAKKSAGRSSSSKKKSAPKEARSKKEKAQRYNYVELSRAPLTASEAQHVYAVIIDASFPYKTNKDKYICSLKVVDPSLNLKREKGTGDSSDYATLILYAKRFEDLPIVTRLGDVIRVHRATLRLHNHQR